MGRLGKITLDNPRGYYEEEAVNLVGGRKASDTPKLNLRETFATRGKTNLLEKAKAAGLLDKGGLGGMSISKSSTTKGLTALGKFSDYTKNNYGSNKSENRWLEVDAHGNYKAKKEVQYVKTNERNQNKPEEFVWAENLLIESSDDEFVSLLSEAQRSIFTKTAECMEAGSVEGILNCFKKFANEFKEHTSAFPTGAIIMYAIVGRYQSTMPDISSAPLTEDQRIALATLATYRESITRKPVSFTAKLPDTIIHIYEDAFEAIQRGSVESIISSLNELYTVISKCNIGSTDAKYPILAPILESVKGTLNKFGIDPTRNNSLGRNNLRNGRNRLSLGSTTRLGDSRDNRYSNMSLATAKENLGLSNGYSYKKDYDERYDRYDNRISSRGYRNDRDYDDRSYSGWSSKEEYQDDLANMRASIDSSYKSNHRDRDGVPRGEYKSKR